MNMCPLVNMSLDDILTLLKDNQWHDTEQISKTLNQSEESIKVILDFYERFSFIRFDKGRTKVAIDPKVYELILLV